MINQFRNTETNEVVVIKSKGMPMSSLRGMQRLVFVKVVGFGGRKYWTKESALTRI